MPSQAPEAPSVTQTTVHIGDPGTQRRGIRQCARQPADHSRENAGGRGAAGGEAGEGRERQGSGTGGGGHREGCSGPICTSTRKVWVLGRRDSRARSRPGRPGQGPAALFPAFLQLWLPGKVASPCSSRRLEHEPRPRAFGKGVAPDHRALGEFGLLERGRQERIAPAGAARTSATTGAGSEDQAASPGPRVRSPRDVAAGEIRVGA